jgi:hypothetical protein
MKPIRLTPHAEHRLAERGFERGWIERALREPLWTELEPDEPDVERRFALVPERGDRMLRVACSETDDEIRVISVMFDRNAKRRHDRRHVRS